MCNCLRFWKRDTSEVEKTDEGQGFVEKVKTEVNRDVELIADKTGMTGWQVMGLLVVVIVAVVGVVGWCIWRFFKKKRKGKDGKGGDLPADTKDDIDDLQALVGNEEEDNADASKPGKLKNPFNATACRKD